MQVLISEYHQRLAEWGPAWKQLESLQRSHEKLQESLQQSLEESQVGLQLHLLCSLVVWHRLFALFSSSCQLKVFV